MAIPITSANQLERIFSKELEVVLGTVSKKIADQLIQNIGTGIYSGGGDTEYYTRTYDFINAVITPEVKVKGGSVSVTIGMDASKIKPRKAEKKGAFNAHMDLYKNTSWKGISISEALLSWLDEGTPNNTIVSQPTSDYWYSIFGDRGYNKNPDYKKLDKMINEIVEKEFSKIGDVRVQRKR